MDTNTNTKKQLVYVVMYFKVISFLGYNKITKLNAF